MLQSYERDGNAIYRQSFAIIRSEATLDRFSPVEELADHAGVNRKTVLALEAGEDIRVSSLIKILRSMNMLGLLESAIPDSLPGGAAVSRGNHVRLRAAARTKKAGHG